MRKKIFTSNWKVIILAIILYILNIILILQLIPVFESQTLNAKIINLLIFPPNFFFEDLLGINSVKVVDILTWIFQLIYVYILLSLVLYFVKGGKK